MKPFEDMSHVELWGHYEDTSAFTALGVPEYRKVSDLAPDDLLHLLDTNDPPDDLVISALGYRQDEEGNPLGAQPGITISARRNGEQIVAGIPWNLLLHAIERGLRHGGGSTVTVEILARYQR